jgi:hypothetical protein
MICSSSLSLPYDICWIDWQLLVNRGSVGRENGSSRVSLAPAEEEEAVIRSEYLEHAFKKLMLFPTTRIFFASERERKGGRREGVRV